MTAKLTPADELAAKRKPRFSSESAAYAKARQALLAEELEVRRHLGRLARQNRELPEGPELSGDWKFIGMNGNETGLAQMFGRHDTLVLYHWMYGPERNRSCPMCTNLLGPLAANAADLRQQVALAVVSRSKVERMVAFGIERGWRELPYYQAVGDDFSVAIGGFDVEKRAEIPVLMVLRKKGTNVRLHWMGETTMEMADPGEDPRGAVDIAPLWNILDLTPAGRDPKWYPRLSYGD
ncbi:MAG: DUF899 family protein [Polyangiaceae bacterium]|nr:DUF899 family protein [Polyangiaceae bacterium]